MKICSRCGEKIRTTRHHGKNTRTSCPNACKDAEAIHKKVKA